MAHDKLLACEHPLLPKGRSPFPAAHGWFVVLALAINSSFNAFMCMNFSATQAASAAAMGIAEHEAAKFYSVYLLSCMMFMTPVMWQTERYERCGLLCSVLATIAAAWLRWYALYSKTNQYELCMISQVLVGFGACAISTLPGQISHQRFAQHRWALTTSMMLMANYTGWLFGASVPSYFVVDGSVESLTNFFFAQCIYSLFVGVAYIVLFRPLTGEAAHIVNTENAQKSHFGGFVQVFKAMAAKPQFTLQLFTHGLLGAMGFVMPSALLFILEDLGDPKSWGGLLNAAFIGCGVTGGIFLGAMSSDPSRWPRTLKMCYCAGVVASLGCCIVAYGGVLSGLPQFFALLGMMAIGGFATLGFTGVMFEDLARFPNINPDYVLWIGYEIMLGMSSVLNLFCSNPSGFMVLLGTSSLTCMVFSICYRQATP